MKAVTFILILLFLLSGCSLFNSKTHPAQSHAVEQIENSNERLQTIGALSMGVEKTIPKQPDVALQLNEKVQQLAETPTPEQVNQVMQSITDVEAKKALEEQINNLIQEKRRISSESNNIINNLTNANAKLIDDNQATTAELRKLQNPFSAIYYGVSTIIKRVMYFLIGGTIIFFILRAFAASNPVIGTIFAILEHIVAFFLKGVKSLFPKSFEFTGHVEETYYSTLIKIVSVISKNSNPDLLMALSRAMDQREKDIIKEIKADFRI